MKDFLMKGTVPVQSMHQTTHVQFKEKTLKWQLWKGAATGFGY